VRNGKTKKQKLKKKVKRKQNASFFYHQRTLSTQQNCIYTVAGLFLEPQPVIMILHSLPLGVTSCIKVTCVIVIGVVCTL